MHTYPPDRHPLIFDFLLAIALFVTILLHTQVSAGAAPALAPVTGQRADTLLTSSELGIAERSSPTQPSLPAPTAT